MEWESRGYLNYSYSKIKKDYTSNRIMAVSGELGGEGDYVSGCKSNLCIQQMQVFMNKFLFHSLK